MAESWTRPESLAFPTTWRVCEGRKPLANGKVPRFRIQDCTEDLVEPFVHQMVTQFIPDEPLCSHLGVTNDQDSLDEMSDLWRSVLVHRIALIALLDNPEDFEGLSLPIVAGCNATFPQFPDTPDPVLKSASLRSVLNIVEEVSHKVDCFKKYDASVSMYAFGLTVNVAYRGQGLAEQILRARYPLCRAVGIPITVTVFTGLISQHTARNARFDTLAELKTNDYEENGKKVFEGAKTDFILLMAARVSDQD